MNGRSVTIGTFFGIQLRLHYSWLVVFTLIAWTIISGFLPAYYPWLGFGTRVLAGLVITLLFFASVVCHEFAHSLVGKRQGLIIKRITLFLFGGAAELQQEPKDAKAELLMTIAGPATTFVISGLSGLVWLIGNTVHSNGLVIIAESLTVLNLAVGIFNLLPGYPLDGGRILRAIIWMRVKDIVRATRAASYVSYIIAYLMITYGVLEIFAGAVVSGFWLGLLAFFLLQAAQASYMQTATQKRLSTIKVRDVMNRHFITVPALTSVESFVYDYVLRYEQYNFLVTDDDEAIGVVEFSRVMSSSGTMWGDPVSRYMVPLSKDLKLKSNDPADKALQLMEHHNLQILPVYEQKSLVGTVNLRRIDDYILVHRARGDTQVGKGLVIGNEGA